MASIWLGNVPAFMNIPKIVDHLQKKYGMAEPRDVRTGSNAEARRRNQKFCVVEFECNADAEHMHSLSTWMWWPNGRYILVRKAWGKPAFRKKRSEPPMKTTYTRKSQGSSKSNQRDCGHDKYWECSYEHDNWRSSSWKDQTDRASVDDGYHGGRRSTETWYGMVKWWRSQDSRSVPPF